MKQSFCAEALSIAANWPTASLRLSIEYDAAPSFYLAQNGILRPVSRQEAMGTDVEVSIKATKAGIKAEHT